MSNGERSVTTHGMTMLQLLCAISLGTLHRVSTKFIMPISLDGNLICPHTAEEVEQK